MTEQEAIQGLMDKSIDFKYLTQFHDNEEVVLAAVIHQHKSFKYTSERLKNDPFFITKLPLTIHVFQFCSDSIKNNKYISLLAMKTNPFSLQHVSDTLKNDRELVLSCITHNSLSIMYASKELKNDRELVLFSVSQNSGALFYLDDQWINDKEVVFKAFTQLQIDFSSVINDNIDNIFFKLLPNHPYIFLIAPKSLRNNKQFVFTALKLSAALNLRKLSNPNITVSNYLDQENNYNGYIGKDLKNEIGNADPISYLEKYFHSKELEQKLKVKIGDKRMVKI